MVKIHPRGFYSILFTIKLLSGTYPTVQIDASTTGLACGLPCPQQSTEGKPGNCSQMSRAIW